MFGLILKANWPTDPVPVNDVRAADSYVNGMDVDPDDQVAAWPRADLVQVRTLTVRSRRTNRLCDAYVAERR